MPIPNEASSIQESECERCHRTVDTVDIIEVRVPRIQRRVPQSVSWCSDCADEHAYRCSDCDEVWSCRYQWHEGPPAICPECAENYRLCYDCGIVIHHGDSYYSESRDEYYCCDCLPSDDDEKPDCIHEYTYRPTPIFHGGANRIHYGIELEVDAELSTAEDTLDILGGERHTYLKEDGSIDSGYEIVTHPHTLAAHRELWSAPVFRQLRSNGLSADGNGMHVHIQRRYLTRMQIQKMQAFFNHEDNRQFIRDIAERDHQEWAKCNSYLGKLTAHGNCEGRYVALNLSNTNTVEVRIFRGTVRHEKFHKNLDFCAALVAFTNCAIKPWWDLSVASFCNFVRSNRKDYPHLDNFLVSKIYLPAVPKRTDKRSLATCA